ncbi:mRNA splicing factor [Gloeophyllum trabeum ATCC 11539]|uniref:mRNA splicing factor n=1 Tax=Gloeophyllum trabeum (strain ATCC 11539 / FP-39264 / Madison 617) TaxID=670483 RepID=S7RTF8_GLOTA|nr:mRNA splicing factor [Gloeophyllum trabeum ATCC 11539]EPQ57965.1 mRNA splicing factor [Gloeophyllum trabeum ATCC 11539]
MSLAEASESRKARLIALRKRKAGEAVDDSEEVVIRTRNFDPETRTLRKHTPDIEMETVEKAVDGIAEKIIAEDEERRAQDLDLFNIAPKRPNWDLKREMEKKMAKLERQTQRAIHTLIRQRLAAQKGQSDDLVGAMRAQEKEDMEEANSDEE